MDTAQIKAYAPKARNDFIKAVTERAARFGIHGDNKFDTIEFKGDVAIIGTQVFSKKGGELRERLVTKVKQQGFEMFIRSNAYTWFNRFVAIRYMELHDFLDHGFRVLSNTNGSDIPEILEHATEVDLPDLDKEKVAELRLAGDKDNELYRMLVIAQCNALHKAMPFLFEEIDNEAELLLPDNLLHTNSPVRKMVTEIDENLWVDVEIIGWIYQFYISEKKDEVIGKVVKSEDIPAATQLFTPNWIVKYMVQNTLGRMWMATYPDSSLKTKMEYYIEPAEQDKTAPQDLNPEGLSFFDPACGSGHILVEAYDILKEIYLERGYRTRDIPRLILKKNLYGLDIDDRAAQLACFAVLMRARKDDRRLFGRDDLTLNIMSIVETPSIDDLFIDHSNFFQGDAYAEARTIMKKLLDLFSHGKTFGSLIQPPPDIAGKIDIVKAIVDEKLGNWFSKSDVLILKKLVDQACIISRQYDCVVANPPYMGSKGMNPLLKGFLKDNFPDVKSDVFSAFIIRNIAFTLPKGQLGFMSPFVWMFISSYEKLRKLLINEKTITSLIQLEYSGFDGATVPICTFTLENEYTTGYKGGYVRLSDFKGAAIQGQKALEIIQAARKTGK
ncbi:MAG: BREX-1 system adenine-specific DNA-methyltransferase PglX [Deltaproteobacteria bacterium]|uniref:BREX-1 system adenine-specific DNA-methyltransferase PglX n=1 Tax=Desulfobacula sp. TaxID=2593537 RepID=UPI00198DA515|nr:BREX-1 system adenine-specific DNA-methyltransferase PglX [Candidatus Desulfobacula maris]MBL6994748.1 BREX-1 system adenine-specific DNA-methyltransferase PglX [Desulfobacula sp.]